MIPSGPPPITKRDVELNETHVRPSYNSNKTKLTHGLQVYLKCLIA